MKLPGKQMPGTPLTISWKPGVSITRQLRFGQAEPSIKVFNVKSKHLLVETACAKTREKFSERLSDFTGNASAGRRSGQPAAWV